MSAAGSAAEKPKIKNLTTTKHKAVIAELLRTSNSDVLRKGDFTSVADQFGSAAPGDDIQMSPGHPNIYVFTPPRKYI